MRIVVIGGQPDAGSYGDALARAYVGSAESGGHEVRLFRLRDLQFDPILLTPCWWWHVPALLKGRSARVIYSQNSPQWVAVLAREDLFCRNMRRAFLGHCGFHPIKRSRLDKVNDVTQAQRVAWLEEVKKLGRRGA